MRGTSVVLQSALGSGQQGQVLLGYDHALNRRVAVKRVVAERVASLMVEARVLGKVDIPGVTPIHAVTRQGEHWYLIRDYVPGATLRQILAAPADVRAEDVWAWSVQLVRILVRLQEHGLIHRDIKPENLVVCSKGQLHLVDFGLATTDTSETGFAGTRRYAAPEVHRGRVSCKSDIYSAAATIQEAAVVTHVKIPPILRACLAACLISRPYLRPSARLVHSVLRLGQDRRQSGPYVL